MTEDKDPNSRQMALRLSLISAEEPVFLAQGAHYLNREKSKVKFMCVLVVEVKGQVYCEKSLWEP